MVATFGGNVIPKLEKFGFSGICGQVELMLLLGDATLKKLVSCFPA
jgi:hypothetical protein